MTRSSVVCLAVLLAVSLLAGPLRAQDIPRVLNYSGRLALDGRPATGSYRMTFAIYPTDEGSEALWSETHTVSVVEGVFGVLLGSIVPVYPTIAEGSDPMYLGIQVDEAPEMQPRLVLASTAFALRTAVADAVRAQAVGSVASSRAATSARQKAWMASGS